MIAGVRAAETPEEGQRRPRPRVGAWGVGGGPRRGAGGAAGDARAQGDPGLDGGGCAGVPRRSAHVLERTQDEVEDVERVAAEVEEQAAAGVLRLQAPGQRR